MSTNTEPWPHVDRVKKNLELCSAEVISCGISACLEALAPNHDRPETGSNAAVGFNFLCKLLEPTQGKSISVVRQPSWLKADNIAVLLEDCETQQKLHGRLGKHYIRTGAPAYHFTASEKFGSELMAQIAAVSNNPNLRPKEIYQTYIDYANAGDYCRVHIDQTAAFQFNCIICLRHDSSDNKRSKLKLFFDSKPDVEIQLNPHDLIVFEASAIPHARLPLMPGEHVTLLSIGISCEDISD